MRILIVSDTHRHNDNYFRVLKRVGDVDAVVHCGDAEGSEYILNEACSCPFYIVCGNNDFFSELPREEELEIGPHRALITHGHYHGVHGGTEMLKDYAKELGYDIVMFGHIHTPVIEEEDGILILNPGSLTYPRQFGRRPSYIILDADEETGRLEPHLEYL